MMKNQYVRLKTKNRELSVRKIIHVDMDCFFAAVEIRDNPKLANQAIAVGGSAHERGVLCTCNYLARKHGVRSAMSTAYAKRLCPNLVVLPVNMEKYREVAKKIRDIFYEYTPLVEPLSLDEAYLDVSDVQQCRGSATWIAQEIQKKIFDQLHLTASAGVAPNKFLAKIASGWKKPNGLFVIRPQDIATFLPKLPVNELFGVGKVTGKKLHCMGIKTCSDLEAISLEKLTEQFGKFGVKLFYQCRGVDDRSVEPHRVRKSLSVEKTFLNDRLLDENCLQVIDELHSMLVDRIHALSEGYKIKAQYIKVKFSDFKQITHQKISDRCELLQFQRLLLTIIERKSDLLVRLIGIGVLFNTEKSKY